MHEITLYGRIAAGRIALVDDDDYELVTRYRWHARKTGRDGREDQTYAATSGRAGEGHPKVLFMHGLIMGIVGVDHINHDGLDNRRSNLRAASRSENGGNKRRRRTASSQYKGISWNRQSKTWLVQIVRDSIPHYVGTFGDETEAANAYDDAARQMFGAFACVNFPREGESSADWTTEEFATAAPAGAVPLLTGVGVSPYVGVMWDKGRNDRWYSVIKVEGKRSRLGFYFSDIRAALAHDEAARELHGAIAILNFPDGLTPELEAKMLADEAAGEALATAIQEAGNRAKSETMKARPLQTRVCEFCGEQYETRSGMETQYCSEKCTRRAKAQAKREEFGDGRANRATKIATCSVCHNDFAHTSNKEVLYCSSACSSKAYKLRKKAAGEAAA